jgi:hypothetical protein
LHFPICRTKQYARCNFKIGELSLKCDYTYVFIWCNSSCTCWRISRFSSNLRYLDHSI